MTSDAGARDPSMPIFSSAFAVFLRRQLMQAVENYRVGGRKFAELDTAALQERFLSAFRDWGADHPDGGNALNAVSSEFLLQRKPAPLERIVDKVSMVFDGHGPLQSLNREPKVAIALGRWLYVPCLGGLLVARDDDSEAVRRDFSAIVAAVRRGAGQ